MARAAVEWGRGGSKRFCSFKRITVMVCCVNIVAALLVLRSFYSSFFFASSSRVISDPFSVDQTKRIEESIQIRREAEPVELVKAVRKLTKEFSREAKRGLKLPRSLKQKLVYEILHSLQSVNNTNVTKQRELLKRALESKWPILMEEIGLWTPADVVNSEHNDKPENEQDPEEIIPGRPLPPECHAEPHTDYDGTAVRWGLTHHKESAADCCQACLDQANRAKPGQMKCNIWVYCPSEYGCYSPDIYEHKHQECWLKQAVEPRVNFKDKYSESYRTDHSNAPVVVPWISGVVGA